MRPAAWLAVVVLLAGGCGGTDAGPGSHFEPHSSRHRTVDLGPTKGVEGTELALDVPAGWEVLDLADYRSGQMSAGTRRLADRLHVDDREDMADLQVMAAPSRVPGSQFTPYLTVALARGERGDRAVELFRTATAIGSTLDRQDTALGEAEVATGALPIGPLDVVAGMVLVERGDEVVTAAYSDLDEDQVLAVLDLLVTTLADRG